MSMAIKQEKISNGVKIKTAIISLLFVPFLVFAQNGAALPNAGLTPESPFYFFDKLGETLREFFTFNPEGKARLQITFAAERVAEIKVILETKGVAAKGLEVAQSRLQAHLANAAIIVTDQKSKGKDVSILAKELDDKLETPKSVLADSFKTEKQALEAKENELKTQLKAAHKAGDTAKEEAWAQELGQVKAQKELLELKEEDIENELEAEEEKIKEEMEAQHKAEKAVREAEKEKQEIIDEAVEEGVELPANAFAEFDSLLTETRSALQTSNFVEAKNLAKRAEKSLDQIEKTIEELEKKQENKDEAEATIKEAEEEKQEVINEAQKEGIGLPAGAFAKFDRLLAQTKELFAKENYQGAKQLAEQAEDALEDMDKEREKLEKEKENKEEQAKDEEERKREQKAKQQELEGKLKEANKEEAGNTRKETRQKKQSSAVAAGSQELEGIWILEGSKDYYEFKDGKMCGESLDSDGLPRSCLSYQSFTVEGDTLIIGPNAFKWTIVQNKLTLFIPVTGQQTVLSKFVRPVVKLSIPKDYSISLTENQLKLQGVWKSSSGLYISFKFYRFTWQGSAGSGEYCMEVIISGFNPTCNGYTEFTMSGNPFTIAKLEATVTLKDGELEITSEVKGGEKSTYSKTTLPPPPFKGVVEE